MVSTKPYLIRAIHQWCADEGFTPYLAVQVDAATRVPRDFVRDGQIVLNVSAEATHQLLMGNDEITFQTRFNGASFPVQVPVSAVLAIYASENGQGMAFEPAAGNQETPQVGAGETAGDDVEIAAAPQEASADSPARRATHLTRIK